MAGSVIGALRAELSASIAQWQADMGKAADSVKKLSGQFKRVGEEMTQVGGAMSIAITAPLVLFGSKSIQAASDAAEMQSAFKYVFGDMADSVEAWAKQTGDALGRSSIVMQEQALSFQQLFKQAAPTNAEAAKMSQTFAVLAQDLASFYNVSEQDALEKLRAGLVGEAEPLRAFGVFLSAAAVESEALSMGLAATAKELTEQDKIMARAALITKATADAQGDAARTSTSFANQQKAAAAAVQDMQIAVGTALIPVMTDLTGWITQAANAFAALDPETQKWIVGAAGVAAVVGPLVVVLGSLSTAIGAIISIAPMVGAAFTLMTGPIGLTITAVGALVAAWVFFGDDIKRVLGVAWQWVKTTFANIVTTVGNTVTAIKTWLGDRLNAIFKGVTDKITFVSNAFKNLYIAVVGNSYIPDMVDQIGVHMDRLEAEMVKPATEAVRKTQESFRELLTSTQAVLSSLMTPQERATQAFIDDMTTLDQALAAKIITLDQYTAAVERLQARMAEAVAIQIPKAGEITVGQAPPLSSTDWVDTFKTSMADAANDNEALRSNFARIFADGMEAGLSGQGGDWLRGFFTDMLRNAARTALENAGGMIFDALGKGGGGGLGGFISGLFKSGGASGGAAGASGGFGGFIKSIFSGGFRAGGGRVNPGRSYVVGEFRPEVFKPSVSGTIEPGTGGGTQIFNITTPDADSFRRSQRQIAREARARVAGI